MNEEAIRKQAKKIMDEFMAALERVGDSDDNAGFERGDGVRKPGKDAADEDFRKRFLDNAPKKRSGYVVAERKKW